MEKLLFNAYRFSAANSARVDIPGQQQGLLTADGRYGFDCSGFVHYLLKKGGYTVGDYLNVSGMIKQSDGSLTTAAAKWQTSVKNDEAMAGDLVYFEGHVGIVVAYNPKTGMGIFRSSTSGYGVTDQPFSTTPGPTWWGTKKQFLAFTRINETKYDNDADSWKGSYSNTLPALQASPAIPSAENPNPSVYANSWLAQTAAIESRGTANQGYDAINNTTNKSGVVIKTALGKYQVLEAGGALTALGYTDKQGNWRIGSREEFLASPQWQEAVALGYVNKLTSELQANGAWDYVGKTINGHLITAEGLVAAAWQFGSNGTKRNLALLDSPLDLDHVIPNGFLGRLDSFRGTALPGSVATTGALGPVFDFNPVSDSNLPVTETAPRIPFGGGNTLTRSSDGSNTYGYTAKSDSSDSVIKQGDLVNVTYDKDGRLVSFVVWHKEDGSIETSVWNADGSEKTYSRWTKNGILQTQKTTKEDDGTLVGEFVIDGQRYHSDGTPIVNSGAIDIPSTVDPSSVQIPTNQTPSESEAIDAVQSEFADSIYGLGEIDVSNFPEMALGFVPTGNDKGIISDLVAQGYTVKQDDTVIVAQKDDEYLIVSAGSIEMIKGTRYCRIDLENDSLVFIDTAIGDETRYVLSELAGSSLLLKGHVTEPLADDIEPDPASFEIDEIISIDGQEVIQEPLQLQAFQQAGFNPLLDIGGEQVEAIILATFPSSSVKTELEISNLDGTTTVLQYDDDGTISNLKYIQLTLEGNRFVQHYNASGTLTSTSSEKTLDDGSFAETVTYADGSVVKLSYDRDGKLLSQQEIESGGRTLAQMGGSLLDALSLVKAIQSGEPLPIVASGLRLANSLLTPAGQPVTNLELSGAANAASGILSLMSLNAALERGDTLGALTAGAQTVSFGALAYIDLAKNTPVLAGSVEVAGNISGILNGTGNGVPGALPVLSLINSIANGDETGTAVSTLMVLNSAGAFASTALATAIPVIGWAYAVYSIVDSLFNSEDIPDPWGSGQFIWDGNGISYQAIGETGGKEAVESVMSNTLATLNAMIEEVRQQNPGSALGIIPNRLPTSGYDTSGYRYTDIDPLTGAEQHPALRFDTSGRPYNAVAGSPESYQSIIEGMVRSALSRGAIAPLWEVQTAKLQSDAGDPKAGLSEEERAGRDGQLTTPITGSTQIFRPVVLDGDGDGIETTDRAHGVAFDVDDSGYLKQTAWIKGDDALLVLDRNYNGQFDSGRELFANGAVALSRRGLAGMAWVDANYDGKLTNADPVWNELKVWHDLDQDGAQDAGEVRGLDSVGVTELNYAMASFTRNGVKQQMASPDLEADSQGTRVTVLPEGILMQASDNGQISLIVTRVADQTAVEANRDGLSGYEDVEIIVNSLDLLANDKPGGTLSIAGLGNFRHGSGFVDANGFVHFTPEANYAGDAAGFDYVAQSASGQTATSTVEVSLQNTNDAPTLGQVNHDPRPIYGYTPVIYNALDDSGTNVQYIAGGNPIYVPYAIQYTTVGEGTITANTIDNPPPGRWDYEYHTTPLAFEDSGAGTLLGTDIDDPATSLSYEIVNQPQYGAVSLSADGSFQYTSWKEPGVASDRIVIDGQYGGTKDGTLYTQKNLPGIFVYPTTDVFEVRITDPQGASTLLSISVPHYGPYMPPTPEGGGGGKPVAVDLSGDGFQFVDVNDSNVFFDINDDGRKHRTAWVGKDDGLLAYDSDGDGQINRTGEISFTRYQEGAQTDLEGLRAFDSNGDARFDATDEQWSRFGIWHDANQNGITDTGEFQSLNEMGITAVNLSSDGKFQIISGQTVHGIGSMSKADGSTLAIADVTLAYSNEIQVHQADGSMASVSDSPFSPNGEEIDGTEGQDLILGKTGNNIAKGLGGDDVIFEDGGNDIVDGGDGNDLLYAGADNDLVLGGAGDDVAYTGPGNDVLFAGEGHDAIFAENGNDVVFGGAGNDLISGGAGNDVLSGDEGDDQLYGESGNDALFGRDGNDELSGMDGNDRLDGGTGNNLLDGGTGADEMIGGAGDDRYVVDDADDTVSELLAEGNDTIQTTLDGYTLGANIENLSLGGVNNLSGNGNELDNTLAGNWGNNLLMGGAGQDKLDGKTGSDTLAGGMGDDIYVVDNADDLVIEAADEGLDTVKASVSHTLTANVEQLSLNGSAALNATGNELDNLLNGNSGNNLIDGEAGVDTMAGGAGDDTYMVDNQDDSVTEFFDEGIDSVLASISFVLPEQIENLTLTGSTDIDGSGNDLNNRLLGNDGTNVLDGAAGDDEMKGGDGHDTYYVDSPGDLVSEALGGGYDTVRSTISLTMPDNIDGLQLLGKDDINATGNSLSNAIVGNSGRNIIDGGSGSDAMAGGTGDDDYIVDSQKDSVTELVFGGIDGVYASISYDLPEQVENLSLLGDSNLDASGNELNNRMTGNTGNNLISAKAGNDQLDGLAGNDTLHGETGNDRILAGAGRDRLYGESGDDYLQGDTGNDMLNGGDGIDFLSGANGQDILRDSRGNNAFFGGRQNDQIAAGAGSDFIAGGKHDDTIQAGSGANVIAFNLGDGNDVLLPALHAANTISLGGKIDKRTLSLQKSGPDLILSMGKNSQITLKDWYDSASNQDVFNLQLVEAAPSRSHGQTLSNGWTIDSFDFKALVQNFDAARDANTSSSPWNMMDTLLDTHLESSDASALGGELAARYAIGGESGISLGMTQETLGYAHFGNRTQAVGQRLDVAVRAYQPS